MKVTWLWKRLNLCNYSLAKWHDLAQTFAMVDYVREMTAKKYCKNGGNGSLEEWLVLSFSYFLSALYLFKSL